MTKRISLILLTLAATGFGQSTAPTTILPTNTPAQLPSILNANFTGLYTTPRQGATRPSTCVTGESFLVTGTPYQAFNCVATDSWLPQLGSPMVGSIPLLNPSFSIPTHTVLASGHNVVYTAPACSCRYLVSAYVNSLPTGTTTYATYPELKVGSSYYASGSAGTITAAAGTGTGFSGSQLILEPGESFSWNVTTANPIVGAYAITTVLSFSSATPLRMYRALAPQTGSTLMYTAPAGKYGIILSTSGIGFRVSPVILTTIEAAATSANSMKVSLVPPSGSPSDSNTFNSILGTGALRSANGISMEFVPPGYSLYTTSDFDAVTSTVLVFIYEYGVN